MLPNERIKTDARNYSKLIFKGHPYATGIARIESYSPPSSECFRVLPRINYYGTNEVLSWYFRHLPIAMDVGKFGSSESARNNF